MDYAIVDLGSNTVRLSIYGYENDEIKTIFKQKELAGLAQYVKNEKLEEEGIQKACDVIIGFKETATKFVPNENIHVFATASLRNINNRDESIRRINQQTNLAVDVLGGEEEAELDFIGASYFTASDSGLLIDIGGASTELVRFENSKPMQLISLPIGSLNLSSKYVSWVLPNKSERKAIKRAVKDELTTLDWESNCPVMLGVGGTLRAALKLSQQLFSPLQDENSFLAENVGKMLRMLQKNENGLYQIIYKTIPERLITITPGLIILKEVIKRFGCETITVSKYGVREGYLLSRVLKVGGSK